MKIGVDAKFASPRYGGLGTYSIKVIDALCRLGRDDILAFVPQGRTLDAQLPRASCTVCPVPPDSVTPDEFFAFRVHWEQNVLPAQLDRHGSDVFFGPAFMAPLAWSGPRVVTVHDLIFLQSDEYNPSQSNLYYRAWAERCARQADAVIAVSQATADDVRSYWGLDGVPVHTIHLASTLSSVPQDRASSQAMAAQFLGTHTPYILYVGKNFPRKNLARLIDAYGQLPADLRQTYRLVLVTERTAALTDLLEQCGVRDQAIVTGYCAAAILPHVYTAATMLIVPSLMEGFGLPVLEAMTCGTPVVAAHVGAIPEVAGDAALLVDPTDIAAIRCAMERVLADADLRLTLGQRGKRRASAFSWERAGEQTREVLAVAARRHHGTTGRVVPSVPPDPHRIA
jgi:alpha-1,3-rhamnosyl/mannosyltransferase